MKHLPGCEIEASKAEYKLMWPNYCRKCDAWGGHRGGDWNNPADWELCPDCIMLGTCPRCGEKVWAAQGESGNPVTCPDCGWDETDPDTCIVSGCGCGYEEEVSE